MNASRGPRKRGFGERLAIALMLAELIMPLQLLGQSGGAYSIDSVAISAGSLSASGPANIEVNGTLAQADALRVSGGVYEVDGAIWPIVSAAQSSSTIFRDGFDP
jgi:hypothetical protein